MFQSDKNTLFDLPHLALIAVNGDDGLNFLQGQLTCDVNRATATHCQSGALCNLKGRILALVNIILIDNTYHLLLPKALLEATLKTLNKVALLSRITLKQRLDVRIFGFVMNNPDDIQPSMSAISWLDNNQGIIIATDETASVVSQPFHERNQFDNAQAWHALQLSEKRVTIYPETRGVFLPHRLDLQTTDTLSFDKGCYKGQEIIARMHYKSTPKHTLALFSFPENQAFKPGDLLFREPDKGEIGQVVDCCQLPDGTTLAAISILKDHPEVCYREDGGNSRLGRNDPTNH